MRIIALALCLLLGCNDNGPGFDWSKQPHQDSIPPVVGRWFEQPQSIGIDPVIYPAPDWTGGIPEYIAPQAGPDTQAAVQDVIAWLKPHGLVYSIGQPASITVKLYYGPWTSSKTTSSVYRGTVEVTDRAASAVPTPPRRTSDYFGLTQVVASSKRYKSATVWINVYPYADFKQQGVDWKANGRAVTHRIVWHELMHTAGLNDDPTGTAPGLMVYRHMTPRPNEKETAVIDWLYGGKAQ